MWIGALIFLLIAFIPYGYYLIRIPKVPEIEYLIPQRLPDISIVINAYKEGDNVRKRMKNLLDTSYPLEKIHFYIVNDGHDEKTEICAREYYGVPVSIFSPYERMGKSACINYMLKTVDTELIIFTDADVTNDRYAIINIIAPFTDIRIGAISSDVIPYGTQNFSTSNEKAYRTIYSKMCAVDSLDHSTINFNGQMLACRHSAVPRISESGADDANIAITAVRRGYKAIYNPHVHVYETQPLTPKAQYQQKIRRANGLITSFLNANIEHPKCQNMLRMRKMMLIISPIALILSGICICISSFPIGIILMGMIIAFCLVFPQTLIGSFIINQFYLIVGLFYRKDIKMWNRVNK